MRLYDVGKDHKESMRLISNVHLITRVYGVAGPLHRRIPRRCACEGILMIFNALSGSSGLVPVMPVGMNQMYYALWE